MLDLIAANAKISGFDGAIARLEDVLAGVLPQVGDRIAIENEIIGAAFQFIDVSLKAGEPVEARNGESGARRTRRRRGKRPDDGRLGGVSQAGEGKKERGNERKAGENNGSKLRAIFGIRQ